VSSALRVITIWAQLRLSVLIAAELGEQVLASALEKPFAWHLQNNSSHVLGHLTKDVDQAFSSIQALLVLVVNLSIVVLLGGSLIALAPGVMLVLGGLLAGFYAVVFRYTRGTLRADGLRLTSNYQASLQVAQEGLGGIRDVLLHRRQGYFLEAYRQRNQAYRLAIAAINIKAQVPRYLIEGFAVILIMGLSLALALSGQGIERQLPLLRTLALGAYRLLQPLQQCFAAISNVQAYQASLLRLRPFLEKRGGESPLQPQNSPALSPAKQDLPLVQFEQLSFRYHSQGSWVLNEIDLAIRSGERLAFVGTTGSGKSTAIDLILGLLVPSQGRVRVHGQDLHATPGLLAAWQRRVAHVPQQIYLSDASFTANIAFGVPEEKIEPERVREAAQQARIAELIETSDDGYATLVGERGVRLSGGQRQRIGIARALYHRAHLLMLDEATSALDNRTEAEVMAAIEALDRQITVVLIAHRLSTVERCDRIVILEHGRITGIGSYEELCHKSEVFQKMAQTR
jgi:ATP-binding cassette subfamily B protein